MRQKLTKEMYQSIILELTDNLKYATDAVLGLLLDDFKDNYDFLAILKASDIKGKRLDKLFTQCCYKDVRCLKDTISMFYLTPVNNQDVYKNIDSDNPIPFISREFLDVDGEVDLDAAADDFNKKFRKNNVR